MDAVETYLQQLPPSQKKEFDRIRTIVLTAEPRAELTMSYGMPTFKYNQKTLLHFGAFKNHLSLFPATNAVIEQVEPRLGPFRTGRGTFQYTEAEPMPDELVAALVRFQRSTIED